ncbi:hypothetical protein PLANPX_0466 [Lacipirellula parvula]|uniref:Uncharacterized protein n=1 Tax=Lacipirellula parvula TaxID=2650471 RepID=A0A5K7X2H4_9BACT|nr:hypothetical protein PLANPX_0466 [Lacipirellula parvula]
MRAPGRNGPYRIERAGVKVTANTQSRHFAAPRQLALNC